MQRDGGGMEEGWRRDGGGMEGKNPNPSREVKLGVSYGKYCGGS